MNIVAFILGMLITLIGGSKVDSSDVIASETDCLCDECCYEEAYNDYVDEFTALFNSYETKWASNGALMIRKGNAGSYRFAKKG